MNNKIKIKDLVLTGVFSVMFFILTFAIGMIGIIPILYFIFPFLNGATSGILVFLFMAKVQKPFLTSVMGLIMGLFMTVSGYPILGLIQTIVLMLIVEILRYIGKYKSFKMNLLANGVFSMNLGSSFLIMYFYKEEIRPLVEKSMGEDYTSRLYKLITLNSVIFVYITAFIGGIIGSLLAKRLLKKHFEKAGVI